jgi:hypothetical protein
MKHSQTIGIVAALLLILLCFFPWSIIPGKELPVTGFETTGTSFGKPALFHLLFCTVMIAFFAIPRIWAKRTNLFLAAINLAWAIRNYILVSSCLMGECPEKQPALYGIVFAAAVMQAMALFPKIPIR